MPVCKIPGIKMVPDAMTSGKSRTIADTLNTYRRVWFIAGLGRAMVGWLAGLLLVGLLLLLADNCFGFPATGRLWLLVLYIFAAIVSLLRFVVMPLINRPSLDAVAVAIEKRCGLEDNVLINSLQFERRQVVQGPLRLRQLEKAFADKTVMQGFARLYEIDKGIFRDKKALVLVVASLLLVGLFWGGYAIRGSRFMVNAATRYIKPLADIPPAGSVEILVEPSDTLVVAEGADCEIKVTVKSLVAGFNLMRYPEIVWRDNSEHIELVAGDVAETGLNSRSLSVSADNSEVYTYKFRDIRDDIAFRILAGDTYSRSISLKVDKLPRVVRSSLTVTHPAYTGKKPDSVISPTGEQSVLAGSELIIAFELDKPVKSVKAVVAEQELAFTGNEKKWQCQWLMARPGIMTVTAEYMPAEQAVSLLELDLRLREDSPPVMAFVSERLNIAVEPGQRMNIPIEIKDDYGIKDLNVTIENSRGGEPELVRKVEYPGPPGSVQAREYFLLTMDAGRFAPGESYIVRAASADFGPAGNIGQARPLALSLASLDEIKIADDSVYLAAFEQLEEAIKAQQAALGICDNIAANLDEIITSDTEASRELLQKHRDSLQAAQKLVGDHLTAAWESCPQPRPEFIIQAEAINKSEHTRVMAKIVVLASQRQLDKNITAGSLANIALVQRLILDKLIALKTAAAQKQPTDGPASDTQENKPDNSVFETLNDRLEKLQAELDNFITSQQQFMYSRDMLGNVAAADLSFEQIDKLDALAVEQWRLAEAISGAINDFTSVDLQDYGDNALVEKLSSIYQAATELDKAVHAAADDRLARIDAYRLETQAVEMAEEIQINCQAVLGYYDDIQFIAEIAEDQQLVAPLAELPDELVDLVGDLLTSQEEMAQEVEDIGSYLNSLDHTAGPVADGTISSTSAKGVTGDQKPEDNVIQGRSGAGRSGMADGQMVEATAKALTDNDYALRERPGNSPLEDGRVEDDDLQAQTGGSGLGKLTDRASTFGLDGVLPPNILRQMQATSTMQQAVIAGTRQLLPRLTRYNLSTAELENALADMERINQAVSGEKTGIDLKRAYNSSLDSLKKSRFAIGDQVRTRYIQTVSGQTSGSGSSTSSQVRYLGYEDMIQAYFRVLAEQDEK